MPKILDDCVRKVKAELIEKGYKPEEAEQKAWAICREATGYSKSKKNNK